jgi:hypothetical protein
MIFRKPFNFKDLGNGANGIRTHDLLHAMQALSHLSYGPDNQDISLIFTILA